MEKCSSGCNLSGVLRGPGNFLLENRPIPATGPNDVLVAIQYVGLCGTDINVYNQGVSDDALHKLPIVLGHEASGIVEQLGSNVSTLKPGDHVAIEPNIPCGSCYLCKSGRYNLCPSLCTHGVPRADKCQDGSLARYKVHPADYCHKLPKNVSLQQGALLEPLSVAVNACRRALLRAGDRVLICGAGSIGMCVLMVAKSSGVQHICITDIQKHRFAIASELGADSTVLVDRDTDAASLSEKIQKEYGMPDVTFECSGSELSTQTAVRVTRPGGTIVLVGIPKQEQQIPVAMAVCRELDIRGSFIYPNCYRNCLALVEKGILKPDTIITHCFPLEKATEAILQLKEGKDNPIKVLVQCAKVPQ